MIRERVNRTAWQSFPPLHSECTVKWSNLSLFPVFRVHGGPGDGDVCGVPAAELHAEVGGAAGDDRYLLTADRGFLHLAVCPL